MNYLKFFVPLRSQFSSLSADSTFPSTGLSLPPLDASAESSEPSEPYYANQTVSLHSAGTPSKAFSSVAPSPLHAAPVASASSTSSTAASGLAGSYNSGGGGGGSKAAQLLRAATHTHATNAGPAALSPSPFSPVPASTPLAGSAHPLPPPPDSRLGQTPSSSERQNGYLEASSKFGFTQPLANGDRPTANEVRLR